jgi:predicted phosphodiesterase
LKIALVTDTHAGVRGDNQNFAAFQRKFWRDEFYPFIDKHGIDTVIHLGDIADRRKYINFLTAKNLREDVIDPAMKRNLNFHVILGNHDVMFKNTNAVNVMDQLFHDYKHPNLNWYADPTELEFDGLKILMMPWINSGNQAQCMDAMRDTKAEVMMGHLEITGFEMHKGAVSDHGFDMDIFSKFDLVMSGHFHHRSRNRNINYLGAPYEMTWSDYNDPKGFHVFDTATRELTFIENPHRMFRKIYYDDLGKTMEQATTVPNDLDGSYVKVIVKNKTNPYWFDMFIDKLEKTGVLDVKTVEDNLNLSLESDEELIDEAEDTLTIMKSYIAAMEVPETEALQLESLISTLYVEALSLE